MSLIPVELAEVKSHLEMSEKSPRAIVRSVINATAQKNERHWS